MTDTVRGEWLTYCRQVVSDDEHRATCAAARGSLAGDGFPSDVRWPGYLGARYASGGVVWMANIHRNFDSAGMDTDFAETAADAVRTFAADGNDESFLTAMANTYLPGLARWTVGQCGRKVLDRLGVALDEIAYLNAARCQSTGTGVELQRLCQHRWPVRETVAMLRPRLLLTTSLTALTEAGTHPWPCTVVGFSQRNGRLVLSSPWQSPSGNRSASAWMDELAIADRERRRIRTSPQS